MNPTAKLVYGNNFSLNAIAEAIGTLANAKCYVGIPDAKATRKNASNNASEPTNAGLLYIHTNGSQLRNIPPRPVIEPSIEANRTVLEAGLVAVADDLFDGKKAQAQRRLKQVGTLAANGAKAWFTDPRNNWPQNAPNTIRRKLSKLKRKTVKANKRYLNAMTVLKLVNQHMPQYGTTALDNINTPLIETGELRRAITHVEEKL